MQGRAAPRRARGWKPAPSRCSSPCGPVGRRCVPRPSRLTPGVPRDLGASGIGSGSLRNGVQQSSGVASHIVDVRRPRCSSSSGVRRSMASHAATRAARSTRQWGMSGEDGPKAHDLTTPTRWPHLRAGSARCRRLAGQCPRRSPALFPGTRLPSIPPSRGRSTVTSASSSNRRPRARGPRCGVARRVVGHVEQRTNALGGRLPSAAALTVGAPARSLVGWSRHGRRGARRRPLRSASYCRVSLHTQQCDGRRPARLTHRLRGRTLRPCQPSPCLRRRHRSPPAELLRGRGGCRRGRAIRSPSCALRAAARCAEATVGWPRPRSRSAASTGGRPPAPPVDPRPRWGVAPAWASWRPLAGRGARRRVWASSAQRPRVVGRFHAPNDRRLRPALRRPHGHGVCRVGAAVAAALPVHARHHAGPPQGRGAPGGGSAASRRAAAWTRSRASACRRRQRPAQVAGLADALAYLRAHGTADESARRGITPAITGCWRRRSPPLQCGGRARYPDGPLRAPPTGRRGRLRWAWRRSGSGIPPT